MDQNGRLKGKFLDLKTDVREVLGLERSLYAVKRDLFAFEMGAKHLPQWFYTRLRSKKGSKNKNYQELMGDGENTEEQQEIKRRYVLRGGRNLQMQGFAAVLWTVQGDAAAKDDEDAELCCGGGGGGARAARE